MFGFLDPAAICVQWMPWIKGRQPLKAMAEPKEQAVAKVSLFMGGGGRGLPGTT